MSDRELVESYEEDLDTLLDEAGFAEDANDPGEDEEFPESDDVTEADLIGEGADAADGYESDEPASAAESPNLEAEQARQYAAQLERMLAMQAAQQTEIRRQQTMNRLMEMRDSMTPDEWANTQSQLLAGYATHLQQTIGNIQQQAAEQQFRAAEHDAREYALTYLTEKLKPNRTEMAALRICETPMQMKRLVEEIKQTRKERTAAARGALREQRLANGADVTGGRGRGAGSPPPKQFANVDELVDSMFQ